MEAPHGPSEDLQDAAVEGDHAVRPGSDFEQIHDGEGTRHQPGRRERGRVRCAGSWEPRSYPVQIVWAAQDPAMPVGTYGEKARAAAGLAVVDRIPGKHFPQEDQAAAIADRVASIVLAAS